MVVICRQKNGVKVYYFPSKSMPNIYYTIVYMSADYRYDCNCEKHAFPSKNSKRYEECSHIKLLKMYIKDMPDMIVYDNRELEYYEI